MNIQLIEITLPSVDKILALCYFYGNIGHRHGGHRLISVNV